MNDYSDLELESWPDFDQLLVNAEVVAVSSDIPAEKIAESFMRRAFHSFRKSDKLQEEYDSFADFAEEMQNERQEILDNLGDMFED